MFDYKRLAIKNFKKGKFDDAALYFSLAYEATSDKNLLFYINLCSFAKTSTDEALMLFDIFYSKEKSGFRDNGIFELLEFLESKSVQNDAMEDQDVISYEDFLMAVKGSNFKNVFENIMFSTKVMISNKDDFLEFISNLIKNDFLEMSMNYLESAATMFSGDERIEKLFDELQKRKNDENLH